MKIKPKQSMSNKGDRGRTSITRLIGNCATNMNINKYYNYCKWCHVNICYDLFNNENKYSTVTNIIKCLFDIHLAYLHNQMSATAISSVTSGNSWLIPSGL